MRQIALVLIAIFGIGLPTHATQVGITAIVGEDIITSADVAERRDLIIATAGIPDTLENQQKITPRIVQSLIDETLQIQEAKRQSLAVTEEELAKAVDATSPRGTGDESLRDFITKRDLSMRSLENQLRAQLLWSKVVQRKLRRNINISEDEVARAQKAAALAPGVTELHIQAIDISIVEDDAKASKLADDLVLELKAGTEMPTLAARHIKHSFFRYNPPIWVPETSLPPALQQALRTLEAGDVTPPIRSDKAIQILQLIDRFSGPKQDDATEYALKQIAISVPTTRDKASFAKLREATDLLHNNPGSCVSEAVPEVGLPVKVNFVRTRLGDMSPQQRSVVSHLEVGDVSDPLPGTDVLRLVMLCEKIEPPADTVTDAEAIRKQLYAEKLELEAQKLLRNLRRDAYIDIKGEAK